MRKVVSRLFTLLFISFFCINLYAQVPAGPKPYRLSLSGKQVTVKSDRAIRNVMVWTINGDRVVEQKNINASSCTIDIPTNHRAYYMMIGFSDGKVFTEKLAQF